MSAGQGPGPDGAREPASAARLASASIWPVVALVAAAFGAYLTFTLAQWHRGEAPSWDLAIFEQGVRGYANLGAPIVDIKGAGFNQLGDHFSPLLVLLAPFYRLFPSPVTLLVAQCVLVAASVWPVASLARRRLGPLPGLALGAAYAFSWGLQTGVAAQFHEYAIAVPLLAFGLAAFLEGRFVAAAVLVGLLLGVKEDLGITVAVFGVIMALQGRRARRQAGEDPVALGAAQREAKCGWITAGVGAAGTLLVLLVIVPAFNPGGVWDYWGRLGQDTGGSADGGGSLGALWAVFADFLVPATKVNTLVLLAALVVGSACVSWLSLLAVPTIVWRFASSNELYWGTDWHYSMMLMPIVFLAAIDALGRLRASPSRPVRVYARATPALAAAFGLVALPYFPLGTLVKPSTYEPWPRAAEAERVFDLIPPGASVASDLGLITRLTSDHTVYWIGISPDTAPDYVVLDSRSGWSTDPGDPAEYAERTYAGNEYRTLLGGPASSGYRVAQRIGCEIPDGAESQGLAPTCEF